jgi:hypothetical protein
MPSTHSGQGFLTNAIGRRCREGFAGTLIPDRNRGSLSEYGIAIKPREFATRAS